MLSAIIASAEVRKYALKPAWRRAAKAGLCMAVPARVLTEPILQAHAKTPARGGRFGFGRAAGSIPYVLAR
jgi:hypothetical protein